MSILFSRNEDANETINRAYKEALKIKFNKNSFNYLKSIYEKYYKIMTVDKDFLKYVECSLITTLIEKVLEKNYRSENITRENIQPGDVLCISAPSLFANHHFFIACVNNNFSKVLVLQSYGGSIRLHKKTFPINVFMKYLEILETCNSEKYGFLEYYHTIIPIEENLYGLTIQPRLKVDPRYIFDEEEYELDEEEYEERKIFDELQKDVDIDEPIYQDILSRYKMRTPVIIKAYRLNEPEPRKTRRRSRSKKYSSRKLN